MKKETVGGVLGVIIVLAVFTAGAFYFSWWLEQPTTSQTLNVPITSVSPTWNGDHGAIYQTLYFDWPNGTLASYIVSCNYYHVGDTIPVTYNLGGNNGQSYNYWQVRYFGLQAGCSY